MRISAAIILTGFTTVGMSTTLSAQSPTPTDSHVVRGLQANITDLQREAFWNSVKDKPVKWTFRVKDVQRGWFSGFWIHGDLGPSAQVLCGLSTEAGKKAEVGAINVGSRVTCSGTLTNYMTILGITTLSINEADVTTTIATR